ncbi:MULTISPECIES: glycoside hydrolase family 3 C-terminal domain-containing protein [Vagococcus]|uniref:Beta-glucosidase n=1 Tax=Vagococcus fluvialis bH819 TaxID=1255619 RepID=A0A1X6WQK8_9ENTE|nr:MULTISPECIES: glycoside hydrolase family 3 C-terminal domain-containing protein [Vagococcus]SLM86565.1 Beta-glucosidase [Vagococcus fluvialis bH819]HCM90772.1 beta-glucosidase [Vagococcus sp.]
MKKYKKILIPLVIILAIVGGVGFYLNKLSQDGVLNMEDVYATISKLLVYFVPAVIVIALIIISLIVFRKKDKKFKFWLKWESAIALLVTILITANVVLFGPMANLLNLQFSDMPKVNKTTLDKNGKLTEEISKEGTVLLKNTDNFLPLEKDTSKLNVFGWSSTQPVYRGTGSGNVDTSSAVDILGSLENAGFETNKDLAKFYTDYRSDRPEVGMWEQDWTLPEPSGKDYSNDMLKQAKNFSDTALVVISRVGGEGADLPTNMASKDITYKGNKGDFEDGDHFLELSKSEKEMLEVVNKNFENIVVLVNSSNAMELNWIEEYDNIKGALWMAGPGATGFSALGDVLTGKVNPSGKTVDTYVRDLKKTPTWNNFGDFGYEGSDYHFINYVENIYVGYKFYETFYKGNEKGYQEAVQYPFGYGLSYSTFEQKMGNISTTKDGDITFDVTVKNTGETAGKDVVQTYFTPPYTNGGIEKSETNLVAFDKTKLLEPGESEKITIKITNEDLAVYDTKGIGGYLLEEGKYAIQLKGNAHTVLDSKDYVVEKTVAYDENNKRRTDEVAAVNKFTDFAEGEVTYLSRKDNFANYKEVTAKPEKIKLSEATKNGLTNSSDYKIKNNDKDKMPETGVKNKMSLVDLKGLDYDDKKWDKLLDQMTVKDMSNIITYGGYQTVEAKSVDKLQTYDFDGPQGISSFFVETSGTAFPTATMIAATWNIDLAEARGEAVGEEAAQIGISGWYGPAMNIHRSAFAGRNFEYYNGTSLKIISPLASVVRV